MWKALCGRYTSADAAEKGRTVTAMSFCFAEGVFMPPVLVSPEFLDRTPTG